MGSHKNHIQTSRYNVYIHRSKGRTKYINKQRLIISRFIYSYLFLVRKQKNTINNVMLYYNIYIAYLNYIVAFIEITITFYWIKRKVNKKTRMLFVTADPHSYF